MPSHAGIAQASSCCQAWRATEVAICSSASVDDSLGYHVHLCLGKAALKGTDENLVLKGMRGQDNVLYGCVQCLQKVKALSAAKISHCHHRAALMHSEKYGPGPSICHHAASATLHYTKDERAADSRNSMPSEVIM